MPSLTPTPAGKILTVKQQFFAWVRAHKAAIVAVKTPGAPPEKKTS